MLRLLGILSLGHLLLGGRHHRLRRGLFLGGLLGFLASRHFDTDRAADQAYWGGKALKIYFAPMEGMTDGILRQA